MNDDSDQTTDEAFRTLDELGAEKRSIEIVDASTDVQKLIGIAQQLDKDQLRKLLRYARRMMRGKDE